MLEECQVASEVQFKNVELTPEDRYELIRLAAEVRVRAEELNMVRVRLDAARAISDAAGDSIVAKMGVPKNAQDVTIDLNSGIIRYLPPANV
jgi:hypothetical protein